MIIAIGPSPKRTNNETSGWDNSRTDVVKIFISHGEKIYGLQFQYFENEALVLGDTHGDFTGPSFNIVNLNYPLEYLTGIRGSGSSYPDSLKSLAFQTNLGLYGPFGGSLGYSNETEFCFDLGEERRHFGGFHGCLNNANAISAIGVYLKPVMEFIPLANKNEDNNNVADTDNVKVED